MAPFLTHRYELHLGSSSNRWIFVRAREDHLRWYVKVSRRLMAKRISIASRSASFTDEDLVEGLRKHSQAAVNHVYQHIYPQAEAVLKRMGATGDDVQDIFQEGMVALWRNIQEGRYELRAETQLSSYLIEICKNKWKEKQRKAQTRYEVRPPQLPDVESPVSFLDAWMNEEEMAILRGKLRELGQRCQEILRRFYFGEESMKELAERFTISVASAKNEKYRCMQRLKARFQKT